MLAFNSQLVLAYLVGGVTFLPLCFLVFVLTLWISLPARGSLLPPPPAHHPPDTLQSSPSQDGLVDDEKKRRKGNGSTGSNNSNNSNSNNGLPPSYSGHHAHAKVLLQSDPRLNREGYFRVSRTPRLGPATESISDYMSNMLFQKNARPKDSVYAALRYDTLYLYESEHRREDKGVLKMTHYSVAIYPDNLPDNEIFNKDHPIVIRLKNNNKGGVSASTTSASASSAASGTTTGAATAATVASSSSASPPSSPDPQENGRGSSKQQQPQRKKSKDSGSGASINGGLPRSSASSTHSSSSSLATQQTPEDADQDAYYIFIQSPVVKEDWYLALLGASKLQKPGTRQKVRDKAHFDPEALNNLVQTLHSSKHHEQTRWFNAFLGRVFLSIYKTQKVKDYFIQKITRKSMKLKRPSFLGQIKVRSFDVGNSIPFITRTRLHDLDPSGELTAEFHLDYKGGVRVEIEVDVGIGLTSIKPVKVTVVLAVLMKAISGMMTLRIKAPPTNRFWLGFQEPPKMDIVIEPIVADKAIKLQMVLNAIETKIREAIIENIVLPNMDDNPFFDSHGRGGVFEGDEIIGGPPSSSSSSALAQEDRGEQAGGDLDHGGEDYEDDEDDESEEEDEDDHLSEDEDEHASIIFNSDPFSIDRMSKEGVGIAGGIAPGMVRQHSSRSNGGFDGKSASIISAPGVLSSEGTPSLMFKRRSYHAGMAGGHHGIDPDHDSESSRSGSTRGEHHQVGQQHLGVNNSSTNGTSGTATGSGSGTTTSKWMAKIKQLSGNHFNRSAESLSDTSSSKLNTKPTVATSTATAVRTTASDLQHKAVRKASKLNESIPKLAASVHLPEAGEVLHEKMARVLGTNHKSQSGSSSTSNSTNNNNPNSSGNVVMGGSVSKDGKQQQQQQQPLSSSPLSASPLHGPVKKLSTASLKRLSTLESPTTVADEDSPGAADSPGTDYTNTISSVQHPVSSAAANASGGENGSESPGLPLESRSSSSTSYSSNVGSSSMRSGFDTFPRATLTRNRQSLPASAVVAATTVAATQATTTPTITPALHGSSSFVGIAGILDGDSERAKNSKVHNTDPQIQQQQQQQQHPTISTSTSTGSLRSAASHLEHVLTRSDEAAEAIRNEAEAAKGSRAPSPSPLSPSWPSAATPTLAEPVVTAVPIISASRSSSDLFSESGGSSGGGGGRRASVDTTSAKNMPLEGGGDDSDMAAQSSTLQRRRSKTAKEGKTEGGKRTSVGGKTHQRQGSLPFLGGRASHPLQTTQTDNGRSATRTSLSEEDRKKAEDRIRESAMLPPTPPGGPSLSRTSSMGDLSLSSFTTSAWRSDQRGGENAVERPDGERRLSFRRGSLTSPPSSLLSTLTTDSEGRSSTRSSSSARTMISNFFKDSSALKTQAATAFSETKARVKRRIEERRMSEDDPLLSGRMRPGD